MDERGQFTFYKSFYEALARIKKKTDRVDAYDAVCLYALTGKEPDLDKLPDAAAVAFLLIKPNLDASRRKAESGKRGGSSKQEETASTGEANDKQTASKPEAMEEPKQEETANEIENEKEGEKENEIEIENENECSLKESRGDGSPPAPRAAAKEQKHKHGKYGWVLLTDTEYQRIVADLGQTETERCVAYVDEAAQATGNKNCWKDWNLTVRKCSRDGWGKQRNNSKPARMSDEERREEYGKSFGSAYAQMLDTEKSGRL